MKYLTLFPIFALSGVMLLSSCSIGGEDEKDKKIHELEIKMESLINEQNIQNEKIQKEKIQIELKKQEENTKNNEFDKNMECTGVGNDLRKTYSNIISGYYNSVENRCYVRYTDNISGKTLEGPSDEMIPIVEQPKPTDVVVGGFKWKLEEKVGLWYSEAKDYCSYLYPKNSWRMPTKNEIDKTRLLNKTLFVGEKFYWTSTPYEGAESYDESYWIFGPHWTWGGKTGNWAGCSIGNVNCLGNDMRTTAVRCVMDL